MDTPDNNLVARIQKTIRHLISKGYEEQDGVVGRLRVLMMDIEGGMIPGLAELEFIDFYEPKSILLRCEKMSPIGRCKICLMEYCAHRAEWERGENTCKKYVERT